jgi:hypothetical protein
MTTRLQEVRERSITKQLKEGPKFVSEISVTFPDSAQELSDWAKRGILREMVKKGMLATEYYGTAIRYSLPVMGEDDVQFAINFIDSMGDANFRTRLKEVYNGESSSTIEKLASLSNNLKELARLTDMLITKKRMKKAS